MIYHGSCHCGWIAFEVEGEITPQTQLIDCNCSICSRKGSLLWFVARAKPRLLGAADALSTYTFNKQTIKHRFCARCGIHPFGEALSPCGEPMAAINVRCLDDFDFSVIPIKHFDGRAL